MKRYRTCHAAAGFIATLGAAHLARAADIEPLHVDISLHGKSFWAQSPNCEGGEWSLAWAGDIPGETTNIGDLLISYGSFDTTLDEEGASVHAKPTFRHTPVVCRDDRGAVVLRANMSGATANELRGVLAMKNDSAVGSPFFSFDVESVGLCRQVAGEGRKVEHERVFINTGTKEYAKISPALSFSRKDLEQGFTKTYEISGRVIAGDSYACLGTEIDKGQLTISYKQDIRKPKVELGTCAHVARGASTEVQAKPSPAGGVLSITSDPAATMSIAIHGNSATVTGATPGRATLTARYVLNGQTATATLPASSTELVSVNGGAAIPKLGLYGVDGLPHSKVYRFPVVTNPADAGDLLSFSAKDSAIVSVVSGRADIGIQPVRTGRTTLQAKTACGEPIGPPVEIVIAACDNDVQTEIQRKRDDLARREKEMVKRITQLVAEPEFQRAATEIKQSTTEFAIKTGELIIGALTAKEVVAGKGGNAASELNAKQLEVVGTIWDGLNVFVDGAVKGEWDKAFVGAAVLKSGLWQASLVKTSLETYDATMNFSRDLGLIAGVARELEELGPKYDDVRRELYRMDVKLARCEESPPPPPPPKPTKPRPPKAETPAPVPPEQPSQEPTPTPAPTPAPPPKETPPPVPPPGPIDPPRSGSAGLCVRPVNEPVPAADLRDVLTAADGYKQVLQQSVQTFREFGNVLKDATAANELADPAARAAGLRAIGPRYEAVVQQYYRQSEAVRMQAKRFTLCTDALPEWVKELKTRY